MSESSYYILLREGGVVVAALGPQLAGDDYPRELCIRGVRYLRLSGEDTFFFWDELRDSDGATVGYAFLLPESPTLRNSYLIRDSRNVALDDEEVRILLQPCHHPEWECVQGFSSEVYARDDDQRDCVIYMFDWSQNRLAFPLQPVV